MRISWASTSSRAATWPPTSTTPSSVSTSRVAFCRALPKVASVDAPLDEFAFAGDHVPALDGGVEVLAVGALEVGNAPANGGVPPGERAVGGVLDDGLGRRPEDGVEEAGHEKAQFGAVEDDAVAVAVALEGFLGGVDGELAVTDGDDGGGDSPAGPDRRGDVQVVELLGVGNLAGGREQEFDCDAGLVLFDEFVLESVEEVGRQREEEFVLGGGDDLLQIAEDGRAGLDERDGLGVAGRCRVGVGEVLDERVERGLEVVEPLPGVDGEDAHRPGLLEFD